MIVLDTNVISELMRAEPAPIVVRWVDAQPAASLYATSLAQSEILLGIALLPRGKRREALSTAAAAIFEQDFAGRVLPFGSDAARAYADLAAARRRAGRPISTIDAQIAAIARSRDAKLATRNVADFDGCHVDVIDPWLGAS